MKIWPKKVKRWSGKAFLVYVVHGVAKTFPKKFPFFKFKKKGRYELESVLSTLFSKGSKAFNFFRKAPSPQDDLFFREDPLSVRKQDTILSTSFQKIKSALGDRFKIFHKNSCAEEVRQESLTDRIKTKSKSFYARKPPPTKGNVTVEDLQDRT